MLATIPAVKANASGTSITAISADVANVRVGVDRTATAGMHFEVKVIRRGVAGGIHPADDLALRNRSDGAPGCSTEEAIGGAGSNGRLASRALHRFDFIVDHAFAEVVDEWRQRRTRWRVRQHWFENAVVVRPGSRVGVVHTSIPQLVVVVGEATEVSVAFPDASARGLSTTREGRRHLAR